MNNTTNPKPWKKILYEDQGYPDNYVADSFLSELKKNVQLTPIKLSSLFLSSCQISQQVAYVAVFIAAFMLLERSPMYALLYAVIPTFMVYVGVVLSQGLEPEGLISWRPMLVFSLGSFCLCPVLVSLTDTISSDSLYIMVALMLLVHLFYHDYSGNDNRMTGDGMLSFNCGIFAAVCLASRLESLMGAFVLLIIAVLCFAVWPHLRTCLKTSKMNVTNVCLTLGWVLFASFIWLHVYPPIAVVFLTFIICVSLGAPYLLKWLHKYKSNIHGPWDEARVIS